MVESSDTDNEVGKSEETVDGMGWDYRVLDDSQKKSEETVQVDDSQKSSWPDKKGIPQILVITFIDIDIIDFFQIDSLRPRNDPWWEASKSRAPVRSFLH